MSEDYLHDLFSLEGQTAVVIGGAGVLGFALAKGLGSAGAHVIIADLKDDACQGRVAELQQCGIQAGWSRSMSPSGRRSRTCWSRRSDRRAGPTSSSTAPGVNAGTPFLEATDADWDRILAINLRAVFQGCQIFGGHMVKSGGGAIVNIGSVTSHLPLSKVFAYSASKAGVLNLTRNVAQEFGPLGVRVNAICPGFFPAEQNRKLLDQERTDNIMRGTPMKRYGEPEELIGALLAPGRPQGRKVHHRHARQRRRRIYGRLVLNHRWPIGNAGFRKRHRTKATLLSRLALKPFRLPPSAFRPPSPLVRFASATWPSTSPSSRRR